MHLFDISSLSQQTTDRRRSFILKSQLGMWFCCMEVFTRLTQQRRRRLISGLKEPKTLGQKTKLTSNGSPSGTFILIEFRKLIIRNIHRIDSNQPLHHFVTHDDLILYFSKFSGQNHRAENNDWASELLSEKPNYKLYTEFEYTPMSNYMQGILYPHRTFSIHNN